MAYKVSGLLYLRLHLPCCMHHSLSSSHTSPSLTIPWTCQAHQSPEHLLHSLPGTLLSWYLHDSSHFPSSYLCKTTPLVMDLPSPTMWHGNTRPPHPKYASFILFHGSPVTYRTYLFPLVYVPHPSMHSFRDQKLLFSLLCMLRTRTEHGISFSSICKKNIRVLWKL